VNVIRRSERFPAAVAMGFDDHIRIDENDRQFPRTQVRSEIKWDGEAMQAIRFG
jgi:hypothetical protein